MLCLVELMALGTNIYDVAFIREATTSTSYDEQPFYYNKSETVYECYMNMAHCTYQHQLMYPFKIAHTIFNGITIGAYVVIYITLNPQLMLRKSSCVGISYFALANGAVIFTLIINSTLLVVMFTIDQYFIRKCSKLTFVTRLENMLTYFLINCVQTVYIMDELLPVPYRPPSHRPTITILTPFSNHVNIADSENNNHQLNTIDINSNDVDA
jgi:hypothetical protein